ncbi:MAG TPA: hypothetical protein VHO67_09980 [Polyangia bacterium]|nr:hypothetical protein [Polyangia bacterium]
MKPQPEPLTAAVRQFRELTGRDAGGDVTRARVLAEAAHRVAARPRWRRAALSTGLLLAIVGTAAVGAGQVGAWRAAAPIVLASDPKSVDTDATHVEHRPRRVIPPVVEAETVPPPSPADEATVYGRAHAAHFGAAEPQAALAAWNDYLRLFPRGRFEPEARFNRAICLVRLRRFPAAAAALTPFAQGRFGSYRRAEAAQLLDWMGPLLPGAAGR